MSQGIGFFVFMLSRKRNKYKRMNSSQYISLVKLFFPIFVLLSSCVYAQNICGEWRNVEEHSLTTFTLSKSDSLNSHFDYLGNYCAVFEDGEKIDFDAEDDSYSITLKRSELDRNHLEGIIKSNAWNGTAKISIVFNPNPGREELSVRMTEVKGTIYFPRKAVFRR